jgi:hypothetical protein
MYRVTKSLTVLLTDSKEGMKLWHLDAPVDTPAAEMMSDRGDVCGLVSQSHCNSKELELLHSNKCRRQHKNQKQDLKRVANLGIQLQKQKQIYKLRTHKLASRAVLCSVHWRINDTLLHCSHAVYIVLHSCCRWLETAQYHILKNAEANLQTQNSHASLTCSLVLRALTHWWYTSTLLTCCICCTAFMLSLTRNSAVSHLKKSRSKFTNSELTR